MIIFLGNGNTNGLYADLINKSKKDKDIVVSCQYRFRVPKSLIESHTCVNIHYGRLPFYGGCNPVYWQIINGEKYAGVTLHYMDENFDTRDITDVELVPIENHTADEIYSMLESCGYDLFRRWYSKILDGTAPRIKQEVEKRKYYPASMVNWENAKKLHGLSSRQIQATHFEGKQYPIIDVNGRSYELRSYDNSL